MINIFKRLKALEQTVKELQSQLELVYDLMHTIRDNQQRFSVPNITQQQAAAQQQRNQCDYCLVTKNNATSQCTCSQLQQNNVQYAAQYAAQQQANPFTLSAAIQAQQQWGAYVNNAINKKTGDGYG